jgi:CRISPR-associated protein Cas5 subtype I-B
MSPEKVLVFDVIGQFRFLKTAEGTRATLSFPFTRTSIIGLIAAILGRDRNTYWSDDDPLANSKIALQFIKSNKHSSLTLNYMHTRERVSIGRGRTISTFLSKGKSRGFVTAVKLDLIRDIHYRIYFSSDNADLYNKIKKYLENNWSFYPPYLGHANLLVDIIYVGEFKLTKIDNKKAKVYSVIPTSILDSNFSEIMENHLAMVTHIPIRSEIVEDEVIGTITENFIIPDGDDKSIEIAVKSDENIYQIEIEDVEKNIVFIPDGREIEKEVIKSIMEGE